jgi:hypothetical protein
MREGWIQVTEWPLNLNVNDVKHFLTNDRPLLTTLHRPQAREL